MGSRRPSRWFGAPATVLLLLGTTALWAEEPIVEATVVPVQRDRAPFTWGVEVGYHYLGALGPGFVALGTDLGAPEATVGLSGPRLEAWLAPTGTWFVGGWWERSTGAASTDLAPTIRHDVTVTIAGGGLLAGVHSDRGWGRLSLRGGIGFGGLVAEVARVELTAPGNWSDYTAQLRTGLTSASWYRRAVASGPLLNLELGYAPIATKVFSLGFRAGGTTLYLPGGGWQDAASGGRITEAPSLWLAGWRLAVVATLGRLELL